MTALLLALALRAQATPHEGFLTLPQGKVWYAIYGENKKKTPLLVLHGGPGIPHNYLLSLKELAADRPVIFYDQLGCGKSDRPDLPALSTVDYYLSELGEVRKQLHLKNVVLYGHSWGTMLAASYLQTHPAGVEAVIFAGPALNVHWWIDDAAKNILTLSQTDQDAIKAAKIDSPEYKKADDDYDAQYLCRTTPMPQDLVDSMAGMGNAYLAMCGPNEFNITGNLKDFDATKTLHNIKQPVLYICGEHDEARPETVKRYADLTPNADMAVISNASHCAMLEQPMAYNLLISGFLRRNKL